MGTTNKRILQKIKHLSNIESVKSPFISLYLNMNSQELLTQREQNRIFLKNSFKNAEKQIKEEYGKQELNNFYKDFEEIEHYIKGKINTKTHGLAIFACREFGIFETFDSIMPFENDFNVNSIAHLKQLVQQSNECESAVVVIVDAKHAKILTIKLGGFIVKESSLEHDVHRFHKQGGWAQMRYQRHINNQVKTHYKAVLQELDKILAESPTENIILAGQTHEVKEFESLMPKRINRKIMGFNRLNINENINKILQVVTKDLAANEEKKELKSVKNIIKKAPVNSVTGLQDTIKLVEEGRIETLILQENKTSSGWKCDGCLYTDKNQYQAGCNKCNGNAIKTELIEEIIRLTCKNNGKVEIVKNDPAERLGQYEGIGALIRY